MTTVQKSEVWMFHRMDNKQGEMSYSLRDGAQESQQSIKQSKKDEIVN